MLEEVEWIEKGIGVDGYGAAYSNHSAAHTHTHTAKQIRKLPPPPRILPRILPAIPLKRLYMAGGVLVKVCLDIIAIHANTHATAAFNHREKKYLVEGVGDAADSGGCGECEEE